MRNSAGFVFLRIRTEPLAGRLGDKLLFATIAPLGRLVVAELAAKLEGEVALEWDELRASDIAGRARAFQSMVGAGMDPSKAAGLAGLMVEE